MNYYSKNACTGCNLEQPRVPLRMLVSLAFASVGLLYTPLQAEHPLHLAFIYICGFVIAFAILCFTGIRLPRMDPLPLWIDLLLWFGSTLFAIVPAGRVIVMLADAANVKTLLNSVFSFCTGLVFGLILTFLFWLFFRNIFLLFSRKHRVRPFAGVALAIWLFSLVQGAASGIASSMNPAYLLYQFVLLILLLGVSRYIGTLIRSWKYSTNGKWAALYSAVYFLVLGGILFLVWPGVWRWDELYTLVYAKQFELNYWQGFWSSIQYTFSYLVFPSGGGIVLVQAFIVSLIVGYIVGDIRNRFHLGRLAWLLLVPFLFPTVLDHNLYPIRLVLYAYLEFLFVYRVFCVISDRKFCLTDGIFFSAAVAVLSSWRSEGVYYCILAPLVFFLFLRKFISKRTLFLLCGSCLALSLFFSFVQTVNVAKVRDYQATAFILPIVPLVQAASADDDAEALAMIDPVFNVDFIRSNIDSGKDGETLFWETTGRADGLVRPSSSAEDYPVFLHGYARLILHHPKTFISERWSTFLKTRTNTRTRRDHVRQR